LTISLDTTLCYKVCQCLATGRWVSKDTPVSSTNVTAHLDITEILLKVALITNTIAIIFVKKSLKIPMGQLESVYRRRTDNTMVKRYQRGNQKPYIEEEQTTQWSKDTTGLIRIRI